MKKVLVVIAQEGFQDVELNGTRESLEKAKFSIVLCSKEAKTCVGKFGGREEATVAMRDVQVGDYDRFAFIGGPGAHVLRDDPEAVNLAKVIGESGKPLGAICIAPAILAAAGVLKFKKATIWNNDDKQGVYLEAHEATYVPEHVVQDGQIVTADGPEVAGEFGRVLAGL
jgi:protease I